MHPKCYAVGVIKGVIAGVIKSHFRQGPFSRSLVRGPLNDGAVETILRKERICVNSHKESADDKRSIRTVQSSLNIFYF